MRSFVLWYNKNGYNKNSGKIKCKVHINLWQDSSRNINYFDFGLMISDIKNISKINMFIPFKVGQNNISDLCKIITSNNDSLINAIFNENYSFEKEIKAKCTQVKKNKEPQFIIYNLDNEQFSIKNLSQGASSILEIDIKSISSSENCKYYFRFRLETNKSTNIIKQNVGESSCLQTLFTGVEVIDFRLNDLRSSCDSIVEKFSDHENFVITKIHYLILRNVRDEFIYHGGEVKARILEDNLWHTYFPNTAKINDDVVAYHIKEENKDGITSFTKLVRFRYRKKDCKSILYWVCFTLVISFIGYILTNVLFPLFGKILVSILLIVFIFILYLLK